MTRVRSLVAALGACFVWSVVTQASSLSPGMGCVCKLSGGGGGGYSSPFYTANTSYTGFAVGIVRPWAPADFDGYVSCASIGLCASSGIISPVDWSPLWTFAANPSFGALYNDPALTTEKVLCGAHLDSQLLCPRGTLLSSITGPSNNIETVGTAPMCAAGRIAIGCIPHRSEFDRHLCSWVRGTRCSTYSSEGSQETLGVAWGVRPALFGFRGLQSDPWVFCCYFDTTGVNQPRASNADPLNPNHKWLINSIYWQGGLSISCAPPTVVVGLCGGSCLDNTGATQTNTMSAYCGGTYRLGGAYASISVTVGIGSTSAHCPPGLVATGVSVTSASSSPPATSITCNNFPHMIDMRMTDRCVVVTIGLGPAFCPSGFGVVAVNVSYAGLASIKCCFISVAAVDGLRPEPMQLPYPYVGNRFASSDVNGVEGPLQAPLSVARPTVHGFYWTPNPDIITAVAYSAFTDTLYMSLSKANGRQNVTYIAAYNLGCDHTVRFFGPNSAMGTMQTNLRRHIDLSVDSVPSTSGVNVVDILTTLRVDGRIGSHSMLSAQPNVWNAGSQAPKCRSNLPSDGTAWNGGAPCAATSIVVHQASNSYYVTANRVMFKVDMTTSIGNKYFGVATPTAVQPTSMTLGGPSVTRSSLVAHVVLTKGMVALQSNTSFLFVNLGATIVRIDIAADTAVKVAGATFGSGANASLFYDFSKWEVPNSDQLDLVASDTVVAPCPRFSNYVYFVSATAPRIFRADLDLRIIRFVGGGFPGGSDQVSVTRPWGMSGFITSVGTMVATGDELYILPRAGSNLIVLTTTSRRVKRSPNPTQCFRNALVNVAPNSNYTWAYNADVGSQSTIQSWACPVIFNGAPVSAITTLSCQSALATGVCVRPTTSPDRLTAPTSPCTPCVGVGGERAPLALKCEGNATVQSAGAGGAGQWLQIDLNSPVTCSGSTTMGITTLCVSRDPTVPECPPGSSSPSYAAIRCSERAAVINNAAVWAGAVDWYAIVSPTGHRECRRTELLAGVCFGANCPRSAATPTNQTLAGAIGCRSMIPHPSNPEAPCGSPSFHSSDPVTCLPGQAVIGIAARNLNSLGEMGFGARPDQHAYVCGGNFPTELDESAIDSCSIQTHCITSDSIIVTAASRSSSPLLCANTDEVTVIRCAKLTGGARLLDCFMLEGDGLLKCPAGYAATSLCGGPVQFTNLDMYSGQVEACGVNRNADAHIKCCRVGVPDVARSAAAPLLPSPLLSSPSPVCYSGGGFTMMNPVATLTSESNLQPLGIGVSGWHFVNTRGCVNNPTPGTQAMRARFYPRLGVLFYSAPALRYIGVIQAEVAYGSGFHGAAFGDPMKPQSNFGTETDLDARFGAIGAPTQIEINPTRDELYYVTRIDGFDYIRAVTLNATHYGQQRIIPLSVSVTGLSAIHSSKIGGGSNTLYLAAAGRVASIDVTSSAASSPTVLAGNGTVGPITGTVLTGTSLPIMYALLVRQEGSNTVVYCGTTTGIVRFRVGGSGFTTWITTSAPVTGIVEPTSDGNIYFVAGKLVYMTMIGLSVATVFSGATGPNVGEQHHLSTVSYGPAARLRFDSITDLSATPDRLYIVDRNERLVSIALTNNFENATSATPPSSLWKTPSPDMLPWRCSALQLTDSTMPTIMAKVYGAYFPLLGFCVDDRDRAGTTTKDNADTRSCEVCGAHIRRTAAAQFHDPAKYLYDVTTVTDQQQTFGVDNTLPNAERHCGYSLVQPSPPSGAERSTDDMLFCTGANSVVVSVCVAHPVFDVPRTVSNTELGAIIDTTAGPIASTTCQLPASDACTAATGVAPSETIECLPLTAGRTVVPETCSWESARAPFGHRCSAGRVATGICVGTRCPNGGSSVRCCGVSLRSSSCIAAPTLLNPQWQTCPAGQAVVSICTSASPGCTPSGPYTSPKYYYTYQPFQGSSVGQITLPLVMIRCAGSLFFDSNAPKQYYAHTASSGAFMTYCPSGYVVTGLRYRPDSSAAPDYVIQCTKLGFGSTMALTSMGIKADTTASDFTSCPSGHFVTGTCAFSGAFSGSCVQSSDGVYRRLACVRVGSIYNGEVGCTPGGVTFVQSGSTATAYKIGTALRNRALDPVSNAVQWMGFTYVQDTRKGLTSDDRNWVYQPSSTVWYASSASPTATPEGTFSRIPKLFWSPIHSAYWYWAGYSYGIYVYPAGSTIGAIGAGYIGVASTGVNTALPMNVNSYKFLDVYTFLIVDSWQTPFFSTVGCINFLDGWNTTGTSGWTTATVGPLVTVTNYYGDCTALPSAVTNVTLSAGRGLPTHLAYAGANAALGHPWERIYFSEAVSNTLQYIDMNARIVVSLGSVPSIFATWCVGGTSCNITGLAYAAGEAGLGTTLFMTVGLSCVLKYDFVTRVASRAAGTACKWPGQSPNTFVGASGIAAVQANRPWNGLFMQQPEALWYDGGVLFFQDTVATQLYGMAISTSLTQYKLFRNVQGINNPLACTGPGARRGPAVSQSVQNPAWRGFAFSYDAPLTLCGTYSSNMQFAVAYANDINVQSHYQSATNTTYAGLTFNPAGPDRIECSPGLFLLSIDFSSGIAQCGEVPGYTWDNTVSAQWYPIDNNTGGINQCAWNVNAITALCIRANSSFGCQQVPSGVTIGRFGAFRCHQAKVMVASPTYSCRSASESNTLSTLCPASMAITQISFTGGRYRVCTPTYYSVGAATTYSGYNPMQLECGAQEVLVAVSTPNGAAAATTITCQGLNIQYTIRSEECHTQFSNHNGGSRSLSCGEGFVATSGCVMYNNDVPAYGYCAFDPVTKTYFQMSLRCCRVDSRHANLRCDLGSAQTSSAGYGGAGIFDLTSNMANIGVSNNNGSSTLRYNPADGYVYTLAPSQRVLWRYDAINVLRSGPSKLSNVSTISANVMRVLRRSTSWDLAVDSLTPYLVVATADNVIFKCTSSYGDMAYLDACSAILGQSGVTGMIQSPTSTFANGRIGRITAMASVGSTVVAAQRGCIFVFDAKNSAFLSSIVDCGFGTVSDNPPSNSFVSNAIKMKLSDSVQAVAASIIGPDLLRVWFMHARRIYKADAPDWTVTPVLSRGDNSATYSYNSWVAQDSLDPLGNNYILNPSTVSIAANPQNCDSLFIVMGAFVLTLFKATNYDRAASVFRLRISYKGTSPPSNQIQFTGVTATPYNVVFRTYDVTGVTTLAAMPYASNSGDRNLAFTRVLNLSAIPADGSSRVGDYRTCSSNNVNCDTATGSFVRLLHSDMHRGTWLCRTAFVTSGAHTVGALCHRPVSVSVNRSVATVSVCFSGYTTPTSCPPGMAVTAVCFGSCGACPSITCALPTTNLLSQPNACYTRTISANGTFDCGSNSVVTAVLPASTMGTSEHFAAVTCCMLRSALVSNEHATTAGEAYKTRNPRNSKCSNARWIASDINTPLAQVPECPARTAAIGLDSQTTRYMVLCDGNLEIDYTTPPIEISLSYPGCAVGYVVTALTVSSGQLFGRCRRLLIGSTSSIDSYVYGTSGTGTVRCPSDMIIGGGSSASNVVCIRVYLPHSFSNCPPNHLRLLTAGIESGIVLPVSNTNGVNIAPEAISQTLVVRAVVNPTSTPTTGVDYFVTSRFPSTIGCLYQRTADNDGLLHSVLCNTALTASSTWSNFVPNATNAQLVYVAAGGNITMVGIVPALYIGNSPTVSYASVRVPTPLRSFQAIFADPQSPLIYAVDNKGSVWKLDSTARGTSARPVKIILDSNAYFGAAPLTGAASGVASLQNISQTVGVWIDSAGVSNLVFGQRTGRRTGLYAFTPSTMMVTRLTGSGNIVSSHPGAVCAGTSCTASTGLTFTQENIQHVAVSQKARLIIYLTKTGYLWAYDGTSLRLLSGTKSSALTWTTHGPLTSGYGFTNNVALSDIRVLGFMVSSMALTDSGLLLMATANGLLQSQMSSNIFANTWPQFEANVLSPSLPRGTTSNVVTPAYERTMCSLTPSENFCGGNATNPPPGVYRAVSNAGQCLASLPTVTKCLTTFAQSNTLVAVCGAPGRPLQCSDPSQGITGHSVSPSRSAFTVRSLVLETVASHLAVSYRR